MAIRTSEQLQQLFEERKKFNQRKKEREKERERNKYKKASEAVKKELSNKLSTNNKIMQQKALKQPKKESFRLIRIYNSNLVERETSEEDLFQTRKELQQYEMDNCGSIGCYINWALWDKLISEFRKKRW